MQQPSIETLTAAISHFLLCIRIHRNLSTSLAHSVHCTPHPLTGYHHTHMNCIHTHSPGHSEATSEDFHGHTTNMPFLRLGQFRKSRRNCTTSESPEQQSPLSFLSRFPFMTTNPLPRSDQDHNIQASFPKMESLDNAVHFHQNKAVIHVIHTPHALSVQLLHPPVAGSLTHMRNLGRMMTHSQAIHAQRESG